MPVKKIGIVGSYFRDTDGCRGRNFDTVIDRPQEITKNGKTWVWNLYGFN